MRPDCRLPFPSNHASPAVPANTRTSASRRGMNPPSTSAAASSLAAPPYRYPPALPGYASEERHLVHRVQHDKDEKDRAQQMNCRHPKSEPSRAAEESEQLRRIQHIADRQGQRQRGSEQKWRRLRRKQAKEPERDEQRRPRAQLARAENRSFGEALELAADAVRVHPERHGPLPDIIRDRNAGLNELRAKLQIVHHLGAHALMPLRSFVFIPLGQNARAIKALVGIAPLQGRSKREQAQQIRNQGQPLIGFLRLVVRDDRHRSSLPLPGGQKIMQRMGSKPDIRIQKGDIIARAMPVSVPYGPVLAGPAGRQRLVDDDLRSKALCNRPRPVLRPVVHDDDFEGKAALMPQRLEQMRQIGLFVPGGDDDGELSLEKERAVRGWNAVPAEQNETRCPCGRQRGHDRDAHTLPPPIRCTSLLRHVYGGWQGIRLRLPAVARAAGTEDQDNINKGRLLLRIFAGSGKPLLIFCPAAYSRLKT
ncbi:hypothetical protein BN871_CT_00170 [Paenibacillus sp. P22]|nr:hypothetical protein BN871_CT_00170 [Paenibacillus sp. P22]